MAHDTSRPAPRAQAVFWDYAFSDEIADIRERISQLAPFG